MLTIPNGLLYAARSLWDDTYTADDAKRDNPEYLRGQVETIMRMSEWDSSVIDSDDVRDLVESAIFAKGA